MDHQLSSNNGPAATRQQSQLPWAGGHSQPGTAVIDSNLDKMWLPERGLMQFCHDEPWLTSLEAAGTCATAKMMPNHAAALTDIRCDQKLEQQVQATT